MNLGYFSDVLSLFVTTCQGNAKAYRTPSKFGVFWMVFVRALRARLHSHRHWALSPPSKLTATVPPFPTIARSFSAVSGCFSRLSAPLSTSTTRSSVGVSASSAGVRALRVRCRAHSTTTASVSVGVLRVRSSSLLRFWWCLPAPPSTSTTYICVVLLVCASRFGGR